MNRNRAGRPTAAVEKLLRVLVAGGVALAGVGPGVALAEEPAPAQDRQGADSKSSPPPGGRTDAEKKAEKKAGEGKGAAKDGETKKDAKPPPAAEEGGGVKGW